MDSLSKLRRDSKEAVIQRYKRYDYYNRIREKSKDEILETTTQESSTFGKLMEGGQKGFATLREMAKNSYRSGDKKLSLSTQRTEKTEAAREIIESYDS